MAFWYFMGGSADYYPRSCYCRIRGLCPDSSRVGFPWRCVRKDADTSDTEALLVPWRILNLFVVPKFISLHWWRELRHQYFLVSLWDSIQGFVIDICVCEECAPSFPFSRLLDSSGFGNSSVSVEDFDSYNIQEIIFMGSGWMWNYTTVCCGRMELEILVRDWSEIWKSLESKSAMMLLFPLMFLEYMDTSLLTILQASHQATMSWPSSFTGSYDAFCIQPSALELYVKARMWYTRLNFWIFL